MATHIKVLSGCILMNTKMTRFRWFAEFFESLCFAFDESSLSIERVNLTILLCFHNMYIRKHLELAHYMLPGALEYPLGD